MIDDDDDDDDDDDMLVLCDNGKHKVEPLDGS
jgi:hypothetical protein